MPLMWGKTAIIVGVLTSAVACGSSAKPAEPTDTQKVAAVADCGTECGSLAQAVRKQCTANDPVAIAGFVDEARKEPATYRQVRAGFKALCPNVRVLSPHDAVASDLASATVGP